MCRTRVLRLKFNMDNKEQIYRRIDWKLVEFSEISHDDFVESISVRLLDGNDAAFSDIYSSNDYNLENLDLDETGYAFRPSDIIDIETGEDKKKPKKIFCGIVAYFTKVQHYMPVYDHVLYFNDVVVNVSSVYGPSINVQYYSVDFIELNRNHFHYDKSNSYTLIDAHTKVLEALSARMRESKMLGYMESTIGLNPPQVTNVVVTNHRHVTVLPQERQVQERTSTFGMSDDEDIRLADSVLQDYKKSQVETQTQQTTKSQNPFTTQSTKLSPTQQGQKITPSFAKLDLKQRKDEQSTLTDEANTSDKSQGSRGSEDVRGTEQNLESEFTVVKRSKSTNSGQKRSRGGFHNHRQ